MRVIANSYDIATGPRPAPMIHRSSPRCAPVMALTGMTLLLALTPIRATDEPPPSPPTTTFRLIPVRPPFAKGPLRELDKSRKTVTVETKDGLLTLTMTDRTAIFRGPEKLTFDKLAPGDILAVRFHTDADGRKIASHAKVYPPPTGDAAGVTTNDTTAATRTALPPVSP
jgi:hypothetical protein